MVWFNFFVTRSRLKRSIFSAYFSHACDISFLTDFSCQNLHISGWPLVYPSSFKQSIDLSVCYCCFRSTQWHEITENLTDIIPLTRLTLCWEVASKETVYILLIVTSRAPTGGCSVLRVCIWCHFLLATLAAAMTGDQQPLKQYVLLRNWGDFRWCYLTNLWIVKTNQWDLW